MRIKEVSPGRFEALIPITVSEGTGDRVLVFTATDETVDRSEDVISFDGWEFDEYLANPVVLWAHQKKERPMIAKTIRIEADKRARAWRFHVKFPTIAELSTDPSKPSEHALFCDCLYNLYKNKYGNAVSVGFSGEGKYRPESKAGGSYISKAKLHELSLVPVPDNPNALQSAKAAGINVSYYMKEVNMATMEKSGARLSKTTREKLEGMHAEHIKLASNLRAFLDEDQGEQEEEGCNKGDGIEEPQPETGGIMKPKAADVPVAKVLILGVSAPEDTNLR
jgi:hypothetical protein